MQDEDIQESTTGNMNNQGDSKAKAKAHDTERHTPTSERGER